MTPRQQRAVDLVASGVLDQITEVAPGFFLVPATTLDGAYYVTTRDNCTCPDSQHRNVVCKHMLILRVRGALDEPRAPEHGTRAAVDAWATRQPVRDMGRMPRATRED